MFFCTMYKIRLFDFVTGNVELTNMQLKPEALNALKLPIKVKAGFLGSVKLKVRDDKSSCNHVENFNL